MTLLLTFYKINRPLCHFVRCFFQCFYFSNVQMCSHVRMWNIFLLFFAQLIDLNIYSVYHMKVCYKMRLKQII